MAVPRAEIPLVILSEASPTSPIAGATIYIKDRVSETLVNVYANAGSTEEKLTQPLSSDSLGRVTGWLPRGSYKVEITVSGKTAYSEYMEISPGSDGTVDTAYIAAEAVTLAKMASSASNAAAGTASLRSLGSTSTTAAAGNDSRLSDERTPTNGSVSTTKIVDEAVTSAKLAAAAKPFVWYAPKVIATEQTITTAEYKVMGENGAGGTSDIIENVVMPENGIIMIGFSARVKSSVSAAGSVSLFLGSNEIRDGAGFSGIGANTVGTGFFVFGTSPFGISAANTSASTFVTTGQMIGSGSVTELQTSRSVLSGGLIAIFAAAGTYSVSVKYKSSSGSVTAKERRLWVFGQGV